MTALAIDRSGAYPVAFDVGTGEIVETPRTPAPVSYAAEKHRAVRAEVAAAARAHYPNAPGKQDAIRWVMNLALNEGGTLCGIEKRVMPRDRRTVQRAIAEAVDMGWLYPQEAIAHEGRRQRWIADWQMFIAEGVELARAQRVKNRVKRDERVAAIRLKFKEFRAANELLRGRQAVAPIERTLLEREDDSLPAIDDATAVADAPTVADVGAPPSADAFVEPSQFFQHEGGKCCDVGDLPPAESIAGLSSFDHDGDDVETPLLEGENCDRSAGEAIEAECRQLSDSKDEGEAEECDAARARDRRQIARPGRPQRPRDRRLSWREADHLEMAALRSSPTRTIKRLSTPAELAEFDVRKRRRREAIKNALRREYWPFFERARRERAEAIAAEPARLAAERAYSAMCSRSWAEQAAKEDEFRRFKAEKLPGEKLSAWRQRAASETTPTASNDAETNIASAAASEEPAIEPVVDAAADRRALKERRRFARPDDFVAFAGMSSVEAANDWNRTLVDDGDLPGPAPVFEDEDEDEREEAA